MINIRSLEEIEIMKEGGKITSKALKKVLEAVKPGVTTLQLDSIAEEIITGNGGYPSFKTVDDYTHTACINVNSGIVHGIPNNCELVPGDVVSIDLGTLYKEYHTDLSYTVEVQTNNEKEFLNLGKSTLEKAVKLCRQGKRIGDVSNVIQTEVEAAGYSVSRDLVGHGVGRELHEDPYVPCYGNPETGAKIKAGMVFAVEVIYQKGAPELVISEDGWTLETEDGSISGLFENTIVVTKNGPVYITSFD